MTNKTQSDSEEEEIRATFKDWFSAVTDFYKNAMIVLTSGKRFETFNAGYQAALASQAEKIKGLEAAARFWQDKAGDMAEEQVRRLEASLFTSCFDRDAYETLMRRSNQKLAKAIEAIAALQARIEAAEEQAARRLVGLCKCGLERDALSERELELLAVIEQKDAAINWYLDSCNKELVTHEFLVKHFSKALALTPDLSALKEHDAKVLEELSGREDISEFTASELRRMAEELRRKL